MFETHSISRDNEAGLATGWLEGALSEAGRRFAAAIGERRPDADLVVASELGRARETADLAFPGRAVPVRLDPRLRACNYGDGNGMPGARLIAGRRRRIDLPFPGGESDRQVVDRVASLLEELARRPNGTVVVLIGHSATRWALAHLLEGTALEDLVDAPFALQAGWTYHLPRGWTGRDATLSRQGGR